MIAAVIAGLAAGALAGWGVGGGSLLLIYLAIFTDATQPQAQGTNLAFFLPAAGTSLISHFRNGFIELHALLWTAVPGVAAAVATSFFASAAQGTWLRCAFGIFLTVTGVVQLVTSFRSLDSEAPRGYNGQNRRKRGK